MIDRSIDQWSSDNRCLFKRTRDRLTNELRKLIWTKPVAINQFFLFLSFFTPPLSLYYFFFFLFPFSPPLFFYKHRCFSLLPIPKDDFLISPRQLASSSFGSTSFSQVLIQRDLTLQKNHRRDPIDDFLFSLISPFFDLHFEKNRSQSLSLPHIQLFLFNSSPEIVLEPITYNLLPSFLSFHLCSPTRHALSRSSSSSRGLCRLHDPTMHARATIYQQLDGSIQILGGDTRFTPNPNLIDSRADHAFFSPRIPPSSIFLSCTRPPFVVVPCIRHTFLQIKKFRIVRIHILADLINLI